MPGFLDSRFLSFLSLVAKFPDVGCLCAGIRVHYCLQRSGHEYICKALKAGGATRFMMCMTF
eukprot:418753-Amphidinium_carterae.1